MKKVNIAIKGMHCKSCEALLEDSFEDLGTNSSKIDHKNGTAIVEFDESKVSLDKIKQAIKEEGYSVIGVKEMN